MGRGRSGHTAWKHKDILEKRKNGKMELEYEIPKTCTAEVIVKEGESYEERI